MTEFTGARGSNTGDDFHELWATRHAIRLLSQDRDLRALVVEGLTKRDEANTPEDAWDGVDCTLYYGGRDASTAGEVVVEQLKYSAANPHTPWTVARLVGGSRRDKSVIARLAKAWKALVKLRKGAAPPIVEFISNQPIDPAAIEAFGRAGRAPVKAPRTKPRESAANEVKLAYAAGLTADEFQSFSQCMRLLGGAGSRFAIEEQVLRAIAEWTDLDIQHEVVGLRQFVRHRMRPEFTGEAITRESVLLHFGVSDGAALFPCPTEILQIESPVSRAPVREAVGLLLGGTQFVCLHGEGGVGKTTALQEMKASLPVDSIMITYDCYGGGRYLDPSELRHRPADAFIQLSNDLCTQLRLPLLLTRHQTSDFPRVFARRLKYAADALAHQSPNALVVVAIDAADNAVTAAQSRPIVESCFVHDFVKFESIPSNVRFVITTRTGRKHLLELPSRYQSREIRPFSQPETASNVARVWAAPPNWIEDFHHLSGGVPRVQAYALKAGTHDHATAIEHLRPNGKSLDELFRQQFEEATRKSGNIAEVKALCAGLIALPRPIPLRDLAGVLKASEAHLIDTCGDLRPGIRLHNDSVGFADEDFEHFVREEGLEQLGRVQDAAASWLLSRASLDQYAAIGVAHALAAAGRGSELLSLAEREPAPSAVTDPVMRREAEVQRLRLAIQVCREAGDAERALRFVLIGAEGLKTEVALRKLLLDNPDLAAAFAGETAGRLILGDPDQVKMHGALLFQKLSVDALAADSISVREGRRIIRAWLNARAHDQERRRGQAWKISISDIESAIQATLVLEGPEKALEELDSWTPRQTAANVGLSLPSRLIAEGRADLVESVATCDQTPDIGRAILLIPLALSGRSVDVAQVESGLASLRRHRIRIRRFFHGGAGSEDSVHARILDMTLTACEILSSHGAANELVDGLLEDFLVDDFRRIDKRFGSETLKLDLLFRAFALREARAGRSPVAKDIFLPRPQLSAEESDQKKARNYSRTTEEHDRPLNDLTGAVFGIYAATASRMANRASSTEAVDSLQKAADSLAREEWRISRQYESRTMRHLVAKSLLVLLASDVDASTLMDVATRVHGDWGKGNSIPSAEFVARLSLRGELHARLLADLASCATQTRTMRIGANDKSNALVAYARKMVPISRADANEVFHYAVEAAGELDLEAMAQIRMIQPLSQRGRGVFADARSTALRLSDVVADAAVRLDGYEHFPWANAISALVHLDTPIALANVARWDDAALAHLRETVRPLLNNALELRTVSPEQAAALALFTTDAQAEIAEAINQADTLKLASFPALAEEGARDMVLGDLQPTDAGAASIFATSPPRGQWAAALKLRARFLADRSTFESDSTDLDAKEDERWTDQDAATTLEGPEWASETLLDATALAGAIKRLQTEARARRDYLSIEAILASAESAVELRHRASYLSALAGLEDISVSDGAATALLNAIEHWWSSPAIQGWSQQHLPAILARRLPEFARRIHHDSDNLTRAFNRTRLTASEIQDVLLRGVESHVDQFDSEQLFALVAFAGRRLSPSQAANLCDWYVERLASRIAAADRDSPADEIPKCATEATARFVFAHMGSYDLRMRWRAAHAVRRLARAGDLTTLSAFLSQYDRKVDGVFRDPNLAFYWLGARLWFVLAWDRVAAERPEIASIAGACLLGIALDDGLPHVLVREFARDACRKLHATGHLELEKNVVARLDEVNQSPLARAPAAIPIGKRAAKPKEERRFEFDSMDTIPYWYRGIVGSFATLDMETFLQTAEEWIIDKWGYPGDILAWSAERRGKRLEGQDWALSSHRQGSTPTLERLNTHLEWHAMWCAAGQLLLSEPLVLRKDNDHDWDSFAEKVSREKLSEPPLWSADLLVGTPLVKANWEPSNAALGEWTSQVHEEEFRSELFPDDQAAYVVVDGDAQRRTADRTESGRVSSALVDPVTGGSLLRALQTMEDSWDYKLPDEGEDNEVDEPPYRFLGWLRSPRSRGEGVDEKDPLRGHASIIRSLPGERISRNFKLRRDADWAPRWYVADEDAPMFIYETWGDDERDNARFESGIAATGYRLLAHRSQLQEFLTLEGLDLIIEVEIERRERRDQRFNSNSETEPAEARFDRLYRLKFGGTLEGAEGCLGTWSSDRRAT